MTLAPDHIGFHTRPEVAEAPARVSVVPARKWRHLTQPPEDAPALNNLGLARDVVLTHLADGETNGDPWEITWAHIATDLHNPQAIPLREAEAFVADYHHWARLNAGTDWDPGDADELTTDITRHLRRAGYTEGN